MNIKSEFVTVKREVLEQVVDAAFSTYCSQHLSKLTPALRAALKQPRAEVPKDRIREIFMNHGFTIKDGQTDLKQYVYDAAYALLAAVLQPAQQSCPACGSDCNERDELIKAEREIERLNEELRFLREQPVQEPVAAQHRFRHPQKTKPDWSSWQLCAVRNRPSYEIDSQGYEVEYRELYTALKPAQQVVEPVEITPSHEQLEQLLSGLAHCQSRDLQHEFLRVWIRDWTNHKISKVQQPKHKILTHQEIDDLFPDGCYSLESIRIAECAILKKNGLLP